VTAEYEKTASLTLLSFVAEPGSMEFLRGARWTERLVPPRVVRLTKTTLTRSICLFAQA
jgi:hypothetical protein